MDAVEQVRSFNRLVTRRVGALEDTYLATGRPLGATARCGRSAPPTPTCARCGPGSGSTPAT